MPGTLENKLSISQVTEKYGIGQTTLYRWIHRYERYLRIYIHLRNEYKQTLLRALVNNPKEVIKAIYQELLSNVMQYNRKLNDMTT